MSAVVARLFFQKRQSLHQIVHARAGAFDPLPQRLILRLEVGILDWAAARLC